MPRDSLSTLPGSLWQLCLQCHPCWRVAGPSLPTQLTMAELHEDISSSTYTFSAAGTSLTSLWQGRKGTSWVADLLSGLYQAQVAPDKSKDALMLIPVSHASCRQELQVLQCALQLATCIVQTLAASAILGAVYVSHHPCSMVNLQQGL